MINEQLLNFIKTQQKLGTDNQTIAKMLTAQGWAQADIDQAFQALAVPVPAAPKKGHKALWIIILLIILALIGFGAYKYFGSVSPAASNSSAGDNTSVPAATSSNGYSMTPPTATAAAHTVSSTTIWQSYTLRQKLCWNGFQDGGNCSPNNGVIDINGDGSVLLGAVEYCQYLDYDGQTIDKTPQGFWRLPTISELTSEYAADPSGFGYIDSAYWSSTLGSSTAQAYYISQLPDGSVSTNYTSKINKYYVRCIQP